MLQNVLAYVIIPVYTVLFARDTDLFTTNFSVIGSTNGRQNAFFLWGILVGWYFFRELKGILPLVPNSGREHRVTITACVLLALAVSTPYLPDRLPFQAAFHVVCAFSSSVLLLSCMYSLILKLYRRDRSSYRPYLTGISVTACLSAILLFAAGIVSSALEIFFTISCTILIRRLHRKLYRGQLKGIK